MILKNEMNQTLQYLAKRGNIVRLFGKPELEEKDNAPLQHSLSLLQEHGPKRFKILKE